TPASTSVCDTGRCHPLRLDDPRDRHDLVAAHDERPAFAVGARDLCVYEHILDLLRTAGQPVSRTPASYPKPWQPGFDPPRAPVEPALAAEGFRLLTPDTEERADDAVLTPHLDPLCGSTRREPVDDRLDLIRQRVAGGAQLAGAERVANVAQRRLGFAAFAGLHDLRA